MALKKRAVGISDPPAPFEWKSKPAPGVLGYIQPKAGTKGSLIASSLPALVKWAKEKAYGLTPMDVQYVDSAYYDANVWSSFSVKRFSTPITTKFFGDGTFTVEGRVYPVGTLFTADEGRVLACSSCYFTGLILYKTDRVGGAGHIYLCPKCCTTCTTLACENKVYTAERAGLEGSRASQCTTCCPVVKCPGCSKYHERENISQVEARSLKKANGKVELCKDCAETQVCGKCHLWQKAPKLTVCDGIKMCISCAKEFADRERVKHEKFSQDELPRHGKLTIPSLTARPFRTVSLETEVDGDKTYLSETMYNCGLVRVPQVESYHSGVPEATQWAAFLKHDGSVTGGELISYLYDLSKTEHADALLNVMSKLRSLNKVGKVEYNANCGGHIHIDAHNFDEGNVWRLLTIWNYLEDVTFRLAGAGHKYGHRTLVPGHDRANGGLGYSNQTVKGPWGVKGAASRSAQQQNRMCGLNFQPYFGALGRCECGAYAKRMDMRTCTCNLGKCTIEWRVWNTQANPRILHAWIAYMQAVHALSDTDDEPTSEFEKKHPALGWTQQAWVRTSDVHKNAVWERLKWIFGNLVFTEDEKDSLLYTISQSDINLASERYDELREIKGPSAISVKKATPRNPSARKKGIVIQVPKPGADPFGNLPERERQDAIIRAQQRVRYAFR